MITLDIAQRRYIVLASFDSAYDQVKAHFFRLFMQTTRQQTKAGT
jgi:hypothetical protein